MVVTIIDFITARLDEDEQIANKAADADSPNWVVAGDADSGGDVMDAKYGGYVAYSRESAAFERYDDAAHIARHDPARVLREVAAKRAVIEDVIETLHLIDAELCCCHDRGEIRRGECPERANINANVTLRALASVYATHPDFDPQWSI